ncbi:RipA family octameric membrane protein [Chromohalobacter israelensis]|uniref:RipA family octameric membrane protein n=1 Tax=Chromohalobacter israelensis TaxID=141390 RepID=UPI00265C6A05|nr:hypothetical protein [Chromohalobacter salexigens]MDO0945999.1 hypothetical protein [Chromohalobacter salexigens]
MSNLSEQREYAWSYFQLHAGQRMSTFNFFIIVSALMTTGLAAAITNELPGPILGAFLGVALMISSFAFWKLDQRVKFLIRHAENSLKEIEKAWKLSSDDEFFSTLFSSEEEITSELRSGKTLLSKHLSYSECFGIVYIVFALAGFVGASLSLWRI